MAAATGGRSGWRHAGLSAAAGLPLGLWAASTLDLGGAVFGGEVGVLPVAASAVACGALARGVVRRWLAVVGFSWALFVSLWPTPLSRLVGESVAATTDVGWYGFELLAAAVTVGPIFAGIGACFAGSLVWTAAGFASYAFVFAGLLGAAPVSVAAGACVVGLLFTRDGNRSASAVSVTRPRVWLVTAGFAIGLGWAGFRGGNAAVMPAAGYLTASAMAGGLAGFAVGRGLRARVAISAVCRAVGPVLLCGWAAGLTWLADLSLDVNAFVRSPLAVELLRSLPGVAVAGGLGLSLGVTRGRVTVAVLAGSAVGFVAGSVWAAPDWGPLTTVVAAAALLAGAMTVGGRTGKRWLVAWPAVAAGVAALLVPFVGAAFDEERAVRTAFGTEAAVARAGGMTPALIAGASDAREVSAFRGVGGRVSVWRRDGSRYEVRRGGIAESVATAVPVLTPESPAELLRVALPLLLHDAPRSLLLVGDDAGTGRRVAEDFPLLRVDLVDRPSDGGARMRAAIHGADRPIAVAESRVTIRPSWAGLPDETRYDVVVDDPGTPALPGNALRLTAEWYAAASTRLGDEGVYCQRFRVIDLGPEGVRPVCAAFLTAFDRVTAVAVGGDWMLVGSNRDGPLFGPGLVEAVRRRHVRDALARCGWDWATPLNLWSIDRAGLVAFVDDSAPASVANTACRHRLVTETLRWGTKSAELAAAVGPGAVRLLAFLPGSADVRTVAERIAALTGSEQLAARYPDQPWAYRKELRSLMTEKAGGGVVPVSAEVDAARGETRRSRVGYFEALGAANRAPSVGTVTALKRALEPYDPLVTPFGYAEVAGLWRGLGDEHADRELEAWMHVAYYASAGDRSVRDVLRAIEIVCDRPEVIATAEDRAAYVDGLLGLLERRWRARGLKKPANPEVVLADATDTVTAVQRGLEVMTQSAAAADVGHVERRRAYLEHAVIAPLRGYRHRLTDQISQAESRRDRAGRVSAD